LAGGSSAEGSVLRRSADFRRFFDFRCSSDFRRFAAGFGNFKMRDREDFPTGSTTLHFFFGSVDSSVSVSNFSNFLFDLIGAGTISESELSSWASIVSPRESLMVSPRESTAAVESVARAPLLRGAGPPSSSESKSEESDLLAAVRTISPSLTLGADRWGEPGIFRFKVVFFSLGRSAGFETDCTRSFGTFSRADSLSFFSRGFCWFSLSDLFSVSLLPESLWRER